MASASPRRKELLAELIERFEIIPAKGAEQAGSGLSPKELVQVLAEQKAREVASLPQAAGKAVLGSDTVVALDGEVLGKPIDEADAARMLRALSGREHEVFTGVCVLYPQKRGEKPAQSGGVLRKRVAVGCTKVRFFPLSEEKIAAYIATGSPMDKAGAYGIQDGGLVERIEGSFSNVVGLPLELCKELIESIEEDVKNG